jgi:hypothetical protein
VRLVFFTVCLIAAGIAVLVATDWTAAMPLLWLGVAVPVVEKTVGLKQLVLYDPWRGGPRRVRLGIYALVTVASVLISAALAAWALNASDAVIGFAPLYVVLTAYTAWAIVHVRAHDDG